MSLSTLLIVSSIVSGYAKQLDAKQTMLNTVEISKMTLATDTAGTTTAGPQVDQKEKPIFGGWIYVGDLSVGCSGTLSSTKPTDVSVLFDTGSSVLVLKTQKTFDFVAKEECESIEEMFVDVTGCNAGTCGKCYQHTACYTDHKKDYQITYGSGPVEVSMGSERVEIAGHVIDDVPLGEVTNFNVRTFMRKDFQGIAGLMHNANGAKDGGISLFQSLRKKGMESFGYCINKEGESKLYWFDDRHLPDGAKKVPVICQHHWGVTTNALTVGRKAIKPELSKDGYGTVASGGKGPAPQLCGEDPCVAILDTGTNFIVAPNSIIENALKEIVDAGFNEDCNFNYADLPDLVFTLEKEQFHVKPRHYIVEQQVKSHGKFVKVCALLIGPMEGALQKKAEEKLNAAAAKPGQASMSNVIILGTPFMRSNYIRFTHPQGKDPYIMIHEKCPEDFSEEKKEEIKKNQTAVQKQARTHEGARFVEVSPHGEVINHEGPSVIRNTPDANSGKKIVKRNMQVLQQLGGEWLTKDWLAAMDEGRECTPGKLMNFTKVAEMGDAHALSPMLMVLFSAIVAMFNL
eukprot:gnl/MRDRNA2_/MRDRNA2_90361_c0_seq1.p1 gnl/MRDRNA2_/MRDRNA2_90361_c0~~gnl/MRDRNA2_/MRDRNA2_90361_c0_seq1.p1  ORF type:complete len:572 (+),score=157.46 gnl/MRDRNA2_/MRDRNA2_90361_c0_seq1:67-1782(+)